MAGDFKDPNSVPAIAHRLIATREALGLNQTEFCSNAGIAENTYNQYERAKGRPSLDMALKLCAAYRITLDWIYRGDAAGLPYSMARTIHQKTA